MKVNIKHIFILFCLSVSACCLHAQRVDPYVGSRIFWDINTKTTIFSSGNYGRIIQLHDGRLMAVAESGGIKIAFSLTSGSTWTSEKVIATNPSLINNAVPDALQLSDSTIIVCYNPRPKEPYSEERKFGIRVRRSTDNGETWSSEIFVYDALHTFTEGCWEPALLELPSGELQCYFANEGIYTTTTEQNISMCRSFDKGLTWSEPEIVSFRSGRRDGMPVPLLLEDKGEIVLMIEDNGIAYPQFRPVTVRTTIADNWSSGYISGSHKNRELAFAETLNSSYNAGAPYIRRLPSGETILSYQGTEGRESTDYADMFVMVGDSEARNFKAKTQPFNVAADKRTKWNSLAVTDAGVVFAVGSSNANAANNQIQTMQGIPLDKLTASFGSATIDGVKSSDETWTYPNAEQLIMGAVTKSRWTADFMYDNDYLYFTAFVIDRDIVTSLAMPDGIRLLIDAEDVCTSTPQEGTFNILFQTDRTIVLKKGKSGSWETDTSTSGIEYSVTTKSIYYQLEAAIPWELLGYSKPNTSGRMAVAVERFDRTESDYQIERIPDAKTNSPYTWMELQLLDNGSTSINDAGNEQEIIRLSILGGQIKVVSSEKISGIKMYSFDGRQVFANNRIDNTMAMLPLTDKANICSIWLANGLRINKKIPY